MPTSSHPSRAKMQREVRTLLPRLSLAQANVLGEMVFAKLMVDGCGMTRMCSYLSELLGQAMSTLRQKYREIYYEKEAKAGVKKGRFKRREIVVEDLFAALLRGVLRDWQGPKTLVLALDASTLTDRFTVLSISVVYRGCGIRVAWTMQEGHQEGEWRPHWERMLTLLAEAVPAEWKVLVMADRGLYAPWLFEAIQAKGWHPFLRVKKALSFRAEGQQAFGAIGKRVKRTGREWKGEGEGSEKGERMQGTVFVRWEQGYEEPICAVSDLPASEAKTAWYQLRFWIEDEYKDGKRGWFHWEHTKMTKPERASRLWLVLAIAMQKAVLLGEELEAQEQEVQRKNHRRPSGKKRHRQRARTKVKREQRAEAKASHQAEKQARREAKHAAELARQQERQGQQAAKEAELLAHRSAKAATQQAPTSVPQKPGGKLVGHRPLRECCAERSLPPASDDHQRGSGKPEPAGAGAARSPVGDMQPGGGPLLRLSRGHLQPPQRPMHKEIHHKRAHGSPQEAGP